MSSQPHPVALVTGDRQGVAVELTIINELASNGLRLAFTARDKALRVAGQIESAEIVNE